MLDAIKKLLLEGATSPIVWSLAVGAIMALIHSLVKGKTALVDAILSKAVEIAYGVLSKSAPLTATTVDDKIVVFLGAFKAYFESHGLTVTPKVEAKALAMFHELHAANPVVPAPPGV